MSGVELSLAIFLVHLITILTRSEVLFGWLRNLLVLHLLLSPKFLST